MKIDDGHKHDVRMNLGVLKCILCGHTNEEIRSYTPPVAAPQPPLADAPSSLPPINRLATAKDVFPIAATTKEELQILVRMREGKMDAILIGMWDGRLIKGAIRAIENSYKVVKHNMTRRAVIAEAARKFKAEELNKPVIKGA